MPIKRIENDQPGVHRMYLVGVMIFMTSALVISGCQKTALRPKDDRSQFDQYDQARNQRAQPFLEDEFGRRTPNLSERLLERGE